IKDPSTDEKTKSYAQSFFSKRQRKGASLYDSIELLKKPNYFGSMMLESGDCDALISGYTTSYPNTIRPALQCLGVKEGFNIVAGLYIVVAKKDTYFFADCTVNVNPNADQLAEIAILTADTVKEFDITLRVAMLSFSNFGSAPYAESIKVSQATKLVKQRRPDILIDGEMQADTATVQEILEKTFPFTSLNG